MLLTPEDPLRRVDRHALREGLIEAEFIGDPLPGVEGAFLAGERFLSLVTFTGCAVHIELAPPATGTGPFCFVRLRGPFEHPTLICGRNTRPPRCPACRAPHRDWRASLTGGDAADQSPLTCRACGAEQTAWKWDWKGNAGFGRGFVEIEEIFPGEAAPAPALSAVLARITGGPWRHFYVQNDRGPA
jgi:hypothetical protein